MRFSIDVEVKDLDVLEQDNLLDIAQRALESQIGPFLEKKLRNRIRNWRRKPTFETVIKRSATFVKSNSGPKKGNKAYWHWVWTSKGTDPHGISPKFIGLYDLRIRLDYSAKTDGLSGGYGGPTIYRKYVLNHSIKAREMEDDVLKATEALLIRYLDRYFDRSL